MASSPPPSPAPAPTSAVASYLSSTKETVPASKIQPSPLASGDYEFSGKLSGPPAATYQSQQDAYDAWVRMPPSEKFLAGLLGFKAPKKPTTPTTKSKALADLTKKTEVKPATTKTTTSKALADLTKKTEVKPVVPADKGVVAKITTGDYEVTDAVKDMVNSAVKAAPELAVKAADWNKNLDATVALKSIVSSNQPESVPIKEVIEKNFKALTEGAAFGFTALVTSMRGKATALDSDNLLLMGLKVAGVDRDILESGNTEALFDEINEKVTSRPEVLEALQPWLDEYEKDQETTLSILSDETLNYIDELSSGYNLRLRALERKAGAGDDAFVNTVLASALPDFYKLVMEDKLSYEEAKRLIYAQDNIKNFTASDYSEMMKGLGVSYPSANVTPLELSGWQQKKYQEVILDAIQALPEDRRDKATVANVITMFSQGATNSQLEGINNWLTSGRFQSEMDTHQILGVDREAVVNYFRDPSNSPLFFFGGAAVGGLAGLTRALGKEGAATIWTKARFVGSTGEAGFTVSSQVVDAIAKTETLGTLLKSGEVLGGTLIGGFFGMELKNGIGFLDSNQRAALQALGEDGKTLLYNFDETDREYKDAAKAYVYAVKDKDPLALQDAIDRMQTAIDKQAQLLYERADLFSIQPGFDDTVAVLIEDNRKLQQIKSIGPDAILKAVDEKKTVALNVSGLPDGVTLRYDGATIAGDGRAVERSTTTESELTVIDKDGKEYQWGKVKLNPGTQDYNISGIGEWLEQQKKYGSNKSKEAVWVPVTINPVSGQTASYVNPKTGVLETVDKSVVIDAPVGQRLDVKFSEPGKVSNVNPVYPLEKSPNIASMQLKDAFGQGGQYYGASNVALNFMEGDEVWIGDHKLDPASYGHSERFPAGYHLVTVRDKTGAVTNKTFFFPADSDFSLALAPDPAFEPYSGGGGGGGGGGGYVAPAPAPAKETIIIYGPTCAGARIWLDDVEVYPALNTPYSIDPGYHGIKIVKPGYNDWIKTINIFSGDSTTISPQLEAVVIVPPAEVIKRVWINSGSTDGAKIIINGGWSGAWTPGYVDLSKGLYRLELSKSGYKTKYVPLWVGDVIAYGSLALELARLAGVDINGY